MAKLLIGCYSYKSRAKYGTRYIDVVTDVRDKVKALDQLRGNKQAQIEKANAFEAIFVAPEYLFTKQNTTKAREPLSAAEKEDILRDLKAISNDYPKVLMFPGSIFWEESLATDNAFNKMKQNLIGAELNTKWTAEDPSYYNDTAKTGWNASGKKVPSLAEVAKEADRTSFRAYNTLYGLLAGESAMKFYSKQWDFKETEGSNPAQLLYVPGSSSAAEEIHQFNFGFEICFDHENGALKAKSTGVDFHILVSDSVSTKTGNACLIVGGYLIHASSDHTATGVWGRSAMTVQSVGGPDSGALATNQVACWLVDVQARPDVQPVVVPKVNVMGATGPTTGSGKKLPPGAFRLPGL